MSKIEESVKNVIDELLDHDENFQNSDSCPTRCEDSVQVLDGCSKILNGSYRNDEIAQKIKDIGITVNIVKKLLSVLLFFLVLGFSGCGGNSPKGVVKSFISACESHNYTKASKMVYDSYSGKCETEDYYELPYISGDETHGSLSENHSANLTTGRVDLGTYHIGKTNGTEKYWVSPKEAIIDKDNPNKCIVFVFAERKEKTFTYDDVGSKAYGKTEPIPSSCAYSKNEVEWELEKINGGWMITRIGTAKRYHVVRK